MCFVENSHGSLDCNSIKTHSGQILSQELGTNEIARAGMADAEIERKFRDFARTRFSEDQIRNILEISWTLENQASLEPFFAALTAPSGGAAMLPNNCL